MPFIGDCNIHPPDTKQYKPLPLILSAVFFPNLSGLKKPINSALVCDQRKTQNGSNVPQTLDNQDFHRTGTSSSCQGGNTKAAREPFFNDRILYSFIVFFYSKPQSKE